ncbi:MAG: hypothetical protein WAW73_11335 [Rhodoferax sp.]|jgi:hypothetical protein
MFKFLRSGSPKAPPPVASFRDSAFRDSMPSPTGVQRELIKAAFRDSLRQQGIPSEWVSCEVITVSPTPGEETLQIQLVLMQWQETFLRYGLALEQVLLRELHRLDPATDHTRHQITWRFSPDCGCPFTVMPPPRIWSHAETVLDVVKVEAPGILDRRRTPRPENPGDGYQPTQLSKL